MNGTLDMLLELITDEHLSSYEDLSKQYKETRNPSLLAGTYYKIYQLGYQLSAKFYKIDDEDKNSLMLQAIDTSLLTFDETSSFTNYFSNVYLNILKNEYISQERDKRKANYLADSLQEMMEEGFDVISKSAEPIADFLAQYALTDKEFKLCEYLSQAFTVKEISQIMKVSTVTISRMKKKLQNKLMNMR